MKLLFCLLSIGLLSAQALRTVPFKLVRIDPALDAIVTADAKLEILGEHFGLTEGPVWIREGNSGYLLFSDCAANVIYKWSPTQPLSVFLERSGFTGTNNLNVGQVRAGRREDDGTFTVLNGGTLFHLFSTPPHTCQVQIPPEANVIARRAPIPLFGAGLIEAIPDETILALEDSDDRDANGIRGRAAHIEDVATRLERIGRFGWKAQQATLLAFSGDAYRNEMGITNDLFPNETALGIDPDRLKLCSPTRGIEDVRDRRTRMRGIDNFANFLRFLAPIERGPIDDTVRAGEFLFGSVGCAACHVPVLTTGPSAHPLFDRKPVPLFSDLLLHDVGTGDGIDQAAARGEEIRTPALWGLRFRRPLLHDGSAPTIGAAVVRHANEARSVVENYGALSDGEREQLLAFLASL